MTHDPSPSLVLPSGPDTTVDAADNRLRNGPFGALKRFLATVGQTMPSGRALGFTMALGSVAAPTAAMACDLRAGIPADPDRMFAITEPGVDCVWFDSPVLANTMPINQNTVTRICAKDGVDRFSRGAAELGAGPPSETPGIPADQYFHAVSDRLVAVGGALTALARTADPAYQPPVGSFHVKPLHEQDTRVYFPSGRAAALEHEVAAVAALTPIEPAMCADLQQAMETAVNADRIGWRRSGILSYDNDFAMAANDAYRSWQREQEQRPSPQPQSPQRP